MRHDVICAATFISFFDFLAKIRFIIRLSLLKLFRNLNDFNSLLGINLYCIVGYVWNSNTHIY